MITKSMLEDWRQAKNLAVCSFNIEPDVVVAIQEMYIEAKQLRKDNLKLLNKEELIEKLLAYTSMSMDDHYLTQGMQDTLEDIKDLCDDLNINLEN